MSRIHEALLQASGHRSDIVVHSSDQPETTSGAAALRSNQNISLAELFQTIIAKRLVILAFMVTGFVAALCLSLFQPRLYRARTSIEIEDLNENFQNLRDQDPTSNNIAAESHYQTQIKILQSQVMLERAIDKVNLQSRLDELDRNSFWSRWKSRAQVNPALQREKLVNDVATHLTVQSWGQTRMTQVFYDAPDPKLAADLVNTLVSEFISQSREVRWESTQSTAGWLTGHLDDLKKNLENSEVALQEYANANGLMFTSDKNNVAVEKLQQLQEELSKSQASRTEKQANFEIAKKNPQESLPATLDDPTMREYRQRLTELERQLAELSATLTPEHFKVRKVQAEIEALHQAIETERSNIATRTAHDFEAAQRRERLIRQAYGSQEKTVSDQAVKSIRYNTLLHDVETNRQLYDALQMRIKQAGLAAAMRASNVLVLDKAKAPLLPYSPNLKLNSALGLLAGMFFGVGFVFFRGNLRRNFESPGLTPAYLRLPELGVIPAFEGRSLPFSFYAEPASMLTSDTPFSNGAENGGNGLAKIMSPIAEAYRSTVTSILMPSMERKGRQLIVVTSPEPGTGKTTVTSNLGISAAGIGKRVLLIDADVRRPRLHQLFEIPNDFGLTDVLRKTIPVSNTPLAELVHRTRFAGLYVMTCGTNGSDSPSDLLYSERLAELFRYARREFDLVLVDAPPMLSFADARILGRNSDGVILVIRAGKTKREAAVLACQRFAEDRTRLLGTILNSWDCNQQTGYNSAYNDAYKAYANYNTVEQTNSAVGK